jgi:D-alanine transaminase
MIVYLNGRYIPKEEARISPDDRGFLFGDGIYEVVRAHEGHFFRATSHWQRLRKSLAATEINGPTDAEVQSIAETLLDKNALRSGEATVYLQITRGVAPRKHGYPQPPVAATVYGYAAPFTPPRDKWISGVRVITVPDNRWARCDIKAISLLPNILANQQAQAAGVHEAILVRDGLVTEGSHTNFAAVRDGTFITHPQNNFILNGITRVVVLELCKAVSIPVREFPVSESDLRTLDEAMLLGTTNDVMPVMQINDWTIGNGRPGPTTRRLQKALHELVAREKSGAASAVGAKSL